MGLAFERDRRQHVFRLERALSSETVGKGRGGSMTLSHALARMTLRQGSVAKNRVNRAGAAGPVLPCISHWIST